MKILVLHGEDTVKSRERLINLVAQYKEKNWQIHNESSINQIVTSSLFNEKRLYVLENVFNLNLDNLKSDIDSNIIFWYEGNLPATITKKLPKKAKYEKFDYPKYIFKFLDSFYPGNSNSALILLRRITEKEPAEFVVAMLTRLMKDLFLVKTQENALKYPAWRLNKLKAQASKFSLGKIKDIVDYLAQADIKSKTSDTNLSDSLDLIIIKELK